MSAYVIVNYEISDPVQYQKYVMASVPLLQKHAVEVLVAEPHATVLEGEGQCVNVVLKFKSQEAAMAWYTDPDYQAAKKIRHSSCANSYMVIAKEFVPPAS